MPAAALVAVFAASAAVIWIAGVHLASSTDTLDGRLGLGSALGGLILLAFATNLPEVAITVTAAASGHVALAIGNLLGGIAIQTVVLAVLDTAVRGDRPLSYLAGSLVVVLEAGLVIAVVVVAMMSTLLPESAAIGAVSPGSIAIVAMWGAGLFIVDRAQRGIAWRAEAPEADPGRSRPARRKEEGTGRHRRRSTRAVVAIFGAAALATLAGGVAIEQSGDALAGKLGLGGAVFGATVLAAATALPEISTGFASVRIGDHQLVFSDIFGGNAFLPVLFLVADLIAGRQVLLGAADTDVWMAGLGILLTAIYLVGIVMRPKRRLFGRLGVDSLAVILIYALGIVGLAVINGA
ncbi:MAG: sodium:calcium antiporter [Thermoleophilaceae bacterium]